MLKKLKLKFVIVVMVIVTTLFAAVIGLILYFTRQNFERESVQMMQSLMAQNRQPGPAPRPGQPADPSWFPSFTVTVNPQGQLIASGSPFYDLSNTEQLHELIALALSSEEPVGIVSDAKLRYLVSPDHSTIVFADISQENALLGHIAKTALSVGLIGYAAFFAASLLLANWAVKPVEKAWQEQKQFIADASHELKTPLTVLLTNAEMLKEPCYTCQERQEFAKNILTMSQRMKGLIENLLDLARLDNHTVSLTLNELNFSKLVSDCALPFEPLFFEKNLRLVCEIQSDVHVHGDPQQLSQTIEILLDNALKYSTLSAPVTIRLQPRKNHCLLSVSGGGTPLSPNEQKQVFQRFYRLDPSRSFSGSYGLGLPIAKRIIEEHDGKIWAESDGQTNTFCILLRMNQMKSSQI